MHQKGRTLEEETRKTKSGRVRAREQTIEPQEAARTPTTSTKKKAELGARATGGARTQTLKKTKAKKVTIQKRKLSQKNP